MCLRYNTFFFTSNSCIRACLLTNINFSLPLIEEKKKSIKIAKSTIEMTL